MKEKVALLIFIELIFLASLNVNAEIICNDSDGGKNYSVKGQVCTKGKGCILDDCMSDGLNERYCEGNESYTEKYTCPVACENGKCINGSSEKTMVECSDSDGKKNYAVRGQLSVRYNDNSTEKINDICFGSSTTGRGVKDYFCEESDEGYNYSYDFEVCDCEDGACIGYEMLSIANDSNETENSNATNDADEEIITEEQKEEEIKTEKIFGESCEKNYECESNLCIDSKCGKLTFFKKLIRWLDNLFGVERNY